MDIPNLPTDSLYKFYSMSGVVICVLSLCFYVQKTTEIQKLSLQSSYDLNMNLTYSAIISLKSSRYVILTNNIKKDNYGKIYSKDQRGVVYTNDDIKALKKEIDNDFDKSRIESIKYKNLLDKINEALMHYNIIRYSSLLTSIIGLVLGLYGIHLWQTRIQVYEDIILKKTATDYNHKPCLEEIVGFVDPVVD